MGDVYRYQVPVENATHAADQADLVATNEGPVSSGGQSPLQIGPDIMRGTSAAPAGSHPLATIRARASGAPLSPLQAAKTDTIEIGGRRDTLQAWEILGHVRQSRDGWEVVGGDSPSQDSQPESKETDQKPPEDRPPVPADATKAWEAAEQVAVPILEQGGPAAYSVADAIIKGDAAVAEKAIGHLASMIGGDAAELSERVQSARVTYEDSARRGVGLSENEWAEFSSWCDKFPDDRAEASRQYFHHGDLNGVRAMMTKWKDAGGGFAVTQHNVVELERAAFDNPDLYAVRESDGKVRISLDGRRLTIQEAIRHKLITVSPNR